MTVNNTKILIFGGTNTLTNYLVKKWEEIGQQAIKTANRFTVALSGGRTPIEFYSRLSAMDDFDFWKKTHVFLADEKLVARDNKESNYDLLKKNLFDYVSIPVENIHTIPADAGNAGLAAEHFKGQLERFFEFKPGGFPVFDLILLTIGQDGEIASLYPDSEGLNESGRLTVPVSSNRLKHDAVSITLPVINHARHVVFVVLGKNKAGVVKAVIEDGTSLPAAMVCPGNGDVTFLLDHEAAGKLSYKDRYTHEGQAISLAN